MSGMCLGTSVGAGFWNILVKTGSKMFPRTGVIVQEGSGISYLAPFLYHNHQHPIQFISSHKNLLSHPNEKISPTEIKATSGCSCLNCEKLVMSIKTCDLIYCFPFTDSIFHVLATSVELIFLEARQNSFV